MLPEGTLHLVAVLSGYSNFQFSDGILFEVYFYKALLSRLCNIEWYIVDE
jgi:hypothetical protein